ncbi:MAG: hypothetical protein RIM84_14270 [Alphaproteobacteria bacterium]
MAICLGALLLAAVPARADQTDTRLPELFDKLAAAGEGAESEQLAQAIWSIWLNSGSDTVDLLMQRSVRAMQARRMDEALGLLTTVVELKPDYAEGWNKRATVLYLIGRFEASLADCDKVLELEPRHFGALAGMGMIYNQLEDDEKAYEAYKRALEVHPNMPGPKQEVKRLAPIVEGERI